MRDILGCAWIAAISAALLGCGSGQTENPFATADQPTICYGEECDKYDNWDWCTRDVPPSACGLDRKDENGQVPGGAGENAPENTAARG